MSTETNTPTDERAMGVAERQTGRSEAWYATEVPSIVSGLQASRAISASTAEAAWRLIDERSYERALALVLGEAV
jgi:hypothetical protein